MKQGKTELKPRRGVRLEGMKKLAEESGVSRATIWAILSPKKSHRRKPRPETIEKLRPFGILPAGY
jgi:transcriptional regulator with XRE-family HTH domain